MKADNVVIEPQELAGEAIGWIPLEGRAYLHVSSEGRQDRVVITGVPDAGLDGENVLLLVRVRSRSLAVAGLFMLKIDGHIHSQRARV